VWVCSVYLVTVFSINRNEAPKLRVFREKKPGREKFSSGNTVSLFVSSSRRLLPFVASITLIRRKVKGKNEELVVGISIQDVSWLAFLV
jgi:hypothetical protein